MAMSYYFILVALKLFFWSIFTNEKKLSLSEQIHKKPFSMNQKSTLLLIALCLVSFFGQGQIVSTENFNATTWPPTGWSIKPDSSATPSGNVWNRQTTLTNPTATAHSAPAVARFRSRSFAAGRQQLLVSRPIDYTNRGTGAANLSLWMFRDSLVAANQDSLTIWVNSTDTLNSTAVRLGVIARNRTIALPDTQHVNGWYQYTFQIPAAFTGTNTHFIFQGTSQCAVVNQGAYIYIDDISFDEYPPICTGTPNVGNISPSTNLICGGTGSAILSLSAPITGLVGITYTWQQSASATGPWTTVGTNAITCNTGTITSTTYYQCVVNCSYSSLSYTTPVDTLVVSANLPPVVTVSPASAVYCAGSAGVHLVASGAVTYSWTPATGLNTTTSDTVNASPAANTQYIVRGTDAFGCWDTAAVNVAFNSGPFVGITAAPNDTVCIGNQVVLTSTPSNVTGNTYLWSDSKITRRDTITVSANVTLSVVVTNTAGCSLADTINITAIPPSTANFGYSHTGNTYQFTDSSIAATGTSWSFGDGNGSSNQNPTYTYSAAGTYTVTLVAAGLCGNDTMTQVIVVGPESINNITKENALNVYPNPVHDKINFELANQIISSVSIKNYLGQKVLSVTNPTNTKSISMSTNTLVPGMYVAEVIANGKISSIKFIKQ
jgi:PKD repeat protein